MPLLAVAVALPLLWVLWTYSYWARKGVPYATPLPLVGNFLETALLRKNEGFIFTRLYRQWEGYACVGVYKLWKPALLLRDPELIKEVLVTKFSYFQDNEFYLPESHERIVSRTPFVTAQERWKEARAKMARAMAPDRVRTLHPVLMAKAKELSQFVDRRLGQETDARDLARRYTVDTALAVILGVEAHCLQAAKPSFLNVFVGDSDGGWRAFVKASLFSNFPNQAVNILGIRILSEEAENLYLDLVRRAVVQQKQTGLQGNDFLDVFSNVALSDTIDEQELMEATGRMYVVLMESYEASATTLAAALLNLALRPDIQTKLRASLLEAFPKRLVDMDVLETLPYLDAVITETVRLNESSTTMTRVCNTAATLRPKGQRELLVEPGTLMVVPVYALHRDPKHFPDPERFDPDRFAAGAQSDRHKYAFLPFGEGPRICVGKKYSVAVVKMALAQLVLDWSVSCGPSQRVPPVRDENAIFFSQYKGGIWLRFLPNFIEQRVRNVKEKILPAFSLQ